MEIAKDFIFHVLGRAWLGEGSVEDSGDVRKR